MGNVLEDLWNYLTIPEAYPQQPASQTHIRITLNRPLTWAEREPLRVMRWENDITGEIDVVTAEFHNASAFSLKSASISSRHLYELYADYIGEEFVNAYARAVRTFSDIEG